MFIGVLFALAAGLLWGLVFIAPLLLPNQSPALLSIARYLAFGVVCLPLAVFQWRALKALRWHDWHWAFALSVVGNFIYYGFLSFSIQTLGNPLPSLMIGTLPVIIAVCANLGVAQRTDVSKSARIAWRTLAMPFALLLLGLLLVNWEELALMNGLSTSQYWLGLLAALLAVAAWTWYPLYNDRHLKQAEQAANPISSATWASALGLATLLPSLLMLLTLLAWRVPAASSDLFGGITAQLSALSPQFWALMFTLGFASSWLGTLCWNAACQRLPASISGQLIIFETLAALAFGYAYRGQWPSALSTLGIALLVAGVLLGVRSFARIK